MVTTHNRPNNSSGIVPKNSSYFSTPRKNILKWKQKKSGVGKNGKNATTFVGWNPQIPSTDTKSDINFFFGILCIGERGIFFFFVGCPIQRIGKQRKGDFSNLKLFFILLDGVDEYVQLGSILMTSKNR